MKLNHEQKKIAIAAHHMLTIACTIIDWVIEEIKKLPLFKQAIKKTCNTLQNKLKKIIELLCEFDEDCFMEADDASQWLLEVAQKSIFLSKVEREKILDYINIIKDEL